MPSPLVPEPAVAAGENPRDYARLMSAVYDATMAGGRAPARPRSVIEESWQRMMSKGIEPDGLPEPVVETDSLDTLRRASGLLAVLDEVSRNMEALVAEGDNILVVADARGRVLWRTGSPAVLGLADRLGFVEGAHWGEGAVGTNGIGTALVSNRAVQVFSAEHYSRSHHAWTCAGAPIKDPRTGQVIGVVDVSGPAATVHPTTVALVDVVARLAESHLREQHDRTLNRIRMVAAPILARIGSPALAVDQDGWVAAVDSLPPHNRILLPEQLGPGRAWIPALGMCDVDLLPGGWLFRLSDEDAAPAISRVTLDLRHSGAPALELVGQFGQWRHDISPRHAEILFVLATFRAGRSAPELASDLYGDHTKVLTVRAELSRLRKQFAGLLLGRPYRFPETAAVDVCYPADMSTLLQASTAPAVRAVRGSAPK